MLMAQTLRAPGDWAPIYRPNVVWRGGPVSVQFTPEIFADTVRYTVLDTDGTPIQRQEHPLSPPATADGTGYGVVWSGETNLLDAAQRAARFVDDAPRVGTAYVFEVELLETEATGGGGGGGGGNGGGAQPAGGTPLWVKIGGGLLLLSALSTD